MKVLIVESRSDLGQVWQRHLQRNGMQVVHLRSAEEAIDHLSDNLIDVIVIDLVLDDGGAITVSDFASFRQPRARVIFVTDTTFFSDGSIFNHASNACAFIQSATPPEDIAAMVEHYAAS